MLLCCFGTIEIDVQYQIVLIYRNINENVCLSASVANFIFWLENEAYFPQENKHYTYTPRIKNVYKENIASAKVLEKNGFKRVEDREVFSISRQENVPSVNYEYR